MLYTGVVALTMLTGVGGMMSNYGWREAQQVEIDAALRAAVSAIGNLLDGLSNTDTAAATEALIKDRVAKFLDGLLANIDVDDDDVTVAHESTSRITRITVGGQATVDFDELFASDSSGNSNVGLTTQTVAVQLLTDRYEIAVATDLTQSMRNKMADADGGFTGPKRIDALKTAADVIEDVLTERAEADPGSMTVAVVPFGSAVNVADTTGSGDTEGKRRYAHMLMGAAIDTDEARATTRHWVDTFHDHGTGANMGALQSRSLPDFYLGSKDADGNTRTSTTADWDLRADEDIDVSSLAPLNTWSVNGKDFWNGCVMARWGAHWHPDARASNDENVTTMSWPAKADVDGWTTLSAGLTNEPLHLSDAPPDHADPHTRFTAYSWPDARIAVNADMQLHTVMVEMLGDNARPTTASTEHTVNDTVISHVALSRRYNNWATRDATRGTDGSSLCPEQAILPLTNSSTTVGTAFDELTVIKSHGNRFSNTLLHLGVVWGLRALSPLWADIWANSNPPIATCAEGETADCDPKLKKSIVLITDGYPYIYRPLRGRVADKRSTASPANPNMTAFGNSYDSQSSCSRLDEFSDHYKAAMADTTARAFNTRFSAFVDSTTKEFTNEGLQHLANVVEQVMHANSPVASSKKTAWMSSLSGLTPWQLFRGDGFLDGGGHVVDRLMAADLGLAGRPMLNDHICRRGLSFTPYGRPDDLVQVGSEPVEGVAPFTRGADWTDTPSGISREQIALLDDWLQEACRIAGDRNVAIRVIFLTKRPGGSRQAAFDRLEACIDAAGGDPDVDEVITAPTEQELKEAFESVFRVKRRLRFLD